MLLRKTLKTRGDLREPPVPRPAPSVLQLRKKARTAGAHVVSRRAFRERPLAKQCRSNIYSPVLKNITDPIRTPVSVHLTANQVKSSFSFTSLLWEGGRGTPEVSASERPEGQERSARGWGGVGGADSGGSWATRLPGRGARAGRQDGAHCFLKILLASTPSYT